MLRRLLLLPCPSHLEEQGRAVLEDLIPDTWKAPD